MLNFRGLNFRRISAVTHYLEDIEIIFFWFFHRYVCNPCRLESTARREAERGKKKSAVCIAVTQMWQSWRRHALLHHVVRDTMSHGEGRLPSHKRTLIILDNLASAQHDHREQCIAIGHRISCHWWHHHPWTLHQGGSGGGEGTAWVCKYWPSMMSWYKFYPISTSR